MAWICNDCGYYYGDPNNSYAVCSTMATWHHGFCDYCEQVQIVTEDRDFGYPPLPMRVLVCGGRDFNNLAYVQYHLTAIQNMRAIKCIIHGGAKGADTCADWFANLTGIPKEVYPAEWEKYGKQAGYIRNQQMLDKGRPDLVVAFPGGPGTESMKRLARKAGVKVIDLAKDEDYV